MFTHVTAPSEVTAESHFPSCCDFAESDHILFPVDFSITNYDFEHNFSKNFTKSLKFLQNVPKNFVSTLNNFSVYLKFLGIYLKKTHCHAYDSFVEPDIERGVVVTNKC